MAIQGYFFNAVEQEGYYDRVYDAEDVTSYLDQLVGNGVFPTPSSQLQVTAQSGLNVVVQPGQGWIDGHKMINDAALPLSLEAADVLAARVDRVVFYVDHSARAMGIEVKTGTPAVAPTAPALVRNATRYEMGLATIMVAKGATSITQANISDTRGDSDVCGYVQGLIQQMDTTALFAQWEAAGAEQVEANQQSWDTWFEEVKDELAGSLTIQRSRGGFVTSGTVASFDVVDYVPSYGYAADILDVYVSGLKLAESEYTQSGSVVTLVTPITHDGTVVELDVWSQHANA